MKTQPQLMPLSVNWMISPSTPMLRLCIGEEPVTSPTFVEFLAVYLDGEEARMKLVFRNGLWATFSPSHADIEVVDTNAYDWSAVYSLQSGSGFADSLNHFRDLWSQTGVCPDPRVYEVHNSSWIERIRDQVSETTYKHFLLLGHDGYAEVIAEGYTAVPNNEVRLFN